MSDEPRIGGTQDQSPEEVIARHGEAAAAAVHTYFRLPPEGLARFRDLSRTAYQESGGDYRRAVRRMLRALREDMGDAELRDTILYFGCMVGLQAARSSLHRMVRATEPAERPMSTLIAPPPAVTTQTAPTTRVRQRPVTAPRRADPVSASRHRAGRIVAQVASQSIMDQMLLSDSTPLRSATFGQVRAEMARAGHQARGYLKTRRFLKLLLEASPGHADAERITAHVSDEQAEDARRRVWGAAQ